jgi:hypothetical protein
VAKAALPSNEWLPECGVRAERKRANQIISCVTLALNFGAWSFLFVILHRAFHQAFALAIGPNVRDHLFLDT